MNNSRPGVVSTNTRRKFPLFVVPHLARKRAERAQALTVTRNRRLALVRSAANPSYRDPEIEQGGLSPNPGQVGDSPPPSPTLVRV